MMRKASGLFLYRYYLDTTSSRLPSIMLGTKAVETCAFLWTWLLDAHIPLCVISRTWPDIRSRVVLVPQSAPFHISLANCVWLHGVLLGTFELRKNGLHLPCI